MPPGILRPEENASGETVVGERDDYKTPQRDQNPLNQGLVAYLYK
jgi:hypothetical protein